MDRKKAYQFTHHSMNEEGRRLAQILDQGVNRLRSSGKLIIILEKYGIDDWE